MGKIWLTGAFPDAWLFVLGGLFVLTTLIFPRGIVGLFRQLPGIRPRVEPLPAEERA
jgi:urea transport system permease protein